MDPLSTTLAVVTLATAVKDLVELGQKIHESFSKVSNNLRSAQRVAEDIKEMVEEIRVFYEDKKDVVDSMKDFGASLQGLLAKLRTFEGSILPLLPQAGARRRDRLIRGWDAWRNSNKIEESLLEIKSDIKKIKQTHIMKSTMRTEFKLETLQQATSRGLVDVHTDMAQGFEVIRRDIALLHVTTAAVTMGDISFQRAGRSSDEINRNIIMLAQSTPSTSTPMLRSPNVITEELMTAAYIKLQINDIAAVIEKRSAELAVRKSVPNGVIQWGVSAWPAGHLSMHITLFRRQVVREVTLVHDFLETESLHAISAHDGGAAFKLYSLSLDLSGVDMEHESVRVGNWAIVLNRMLIEASGSVSPDLRADLALCLLSQSIKYDNGDDMTRSLQRVEEAYTISQTLQNQCSTETSFKILHCRVLLQYARLVDLRRSLEMATEAVQVLETILNVHVLILSGSGETVQVNEIINPSAFSLDSISSPASLVAVVTFAEALQYLATNLFMDGRHKNAVDLVFLAVLVRRKIVSIHGHEHRAQLARALASLVQGGIASYLPADEVVDLADECVQLLHQLVEMNPPFYAQILGNVLSKKASTLESLNRNIEAIRIWEEVASLAEKITQDSAMRARALGGLVNQFRRLKRYEDAIKANMLLINTYPDDAATGAWRYSMISDDLLDLQRYKESADAARSSITLYRRLAMGNPDPCRWMSYLADELASLAHCLIILDDYPGAQIAWKESASMLDKFSSSCPATTRSDALNGYLNVLRYYECISLILDENEKCLPICTTALKYYQQLLANYPVHKDIVSGLLRAECFYAYNMLRLGHLEDGRRYIDHWADTWNSRKEVVSGSVDTTGYKVAMMLLKADMLDAQGFVNEALLVNQMTNDGAQKTRLCLRLGDNDGALQVAEVTLQLLRGPNSDTIRQVLRTLQAVSLAAMSCGDYERATEAAREGCNISANPDWQSTYGETECAEIFIRPNLFAILSSAEANLGRCDSAIEYANRAVEASLDIRGMKAYVSATTATQSYMETRGNLADILLATGDLAQARQICEERSTYFSKRVEKRTGEYRDLAPILRMLGLLCCSEGHHEEGEAAAKELSCIMTMLGCAFPSLQEQVKFRLRSQAQVPILQVLNEMNEKLDCGHQAEIALLFSV